MNIFFKNKIIQIFRVFDDAIIKVFSLLGIPNFNRLINRGLYIGKNVSIQGGSFIDPSHCWLIHIDDECTIAPRVMIFAHDASTKRHINYTRIGKVFIGKRTFVGAGSIILPGVTIGENVIIGAGSVITKNIPSNSVVAGNPAKIIKKTDEYIKLNKDNLYKKPTYPANWAITHNITTEMKEEMKSSLSEEGYVE